LVGVPPSRRIARHRVASRERRPLVLGPPGTVLQHRRIRLDLQPRLQERFLLAPDRARAAGKRRALQRPCLLLPDDGALHRRDTHPEAPGGFSQGLTVGHHPDTPLA
jgi:hypothetical protein